MAIANVPVTFKRVGPVPLEDGVFFPTLAAAQSYAANDITALIGQFVIIPLAGSIATYQIQPDKTLKELAGAGGEFSLETEIVPTVTAGGIRAGDVIPLGTLIGEILQRLLNPEVYPSVNSFNCNPPFGIRELGLNATPNITANITKGTNDIRLARIRRLDNNQVLGGEITNIPNGGVITRADSAFATGRRDYRVEVEDIKGLTATAEDYLEFLPPIFLGNHANENLSGPQMLALNKIAARKENFGYVSQSVDTYIHIYYPETWGEVSKIIDTSAINVMDAYREEGRMVHIAGENILYLHYISINKIYIQDYTVHFVFD